MTADGESGVGPASELRLSNLIESQQLTPSIISELFRDADTLMKDGCEPVLRGKILATLFYEPSTRTRFSFESAMIRLGGAVIASENAKEFSSAAKGETLEDTIRIVSSYSDCIVLRHGTEGAAARAAAVSGVPIINGGDGKGQHPTQALLDIFTINKEIGRLDDFKIAMVGDLAQGRTVRSLCYLLGKRANVEMVFVSPDSLRIKDDIKGYLKRHGVKYREETDLSKVLPEVDIVYMTRIQKERMTSEDYEKTKGRYILDMRNLHLIREDARIMHPLPHVEEIDLPLDVERKDKRIAYFRQAENGLYIRMALLKNILLE
jgi:aspartate carbamoyltransferase catalytic subunit